MAKAKLYAIMDKKTGSWEGPMIARTHGDAERKFQTAINNENSGNLNKYPEDFSLWCVGEFDETTGEVEGNKKESLGEAVIFVQAKIQQLNNEQRRA